MKTYIFLIIFVNFCGWLWGAYNPTPTIGLQNKVLLPPSSSPELPVNNTSINPQVFQTFQFSVLSKLYISKDSKINWSYHDKLKKLKEPAGNFIKYKPENSIKGVIRFYNDQLWLGIFDKAITKLLIFYIDDGFDGFIYEGNQEGGKGDGIIDRIAIVSPSQGTTQFVNFIIDKKNNQLRFSDPNERIISLSLNHYNYYFKRTYEKLRDEENQTFVPFDKNRPVMEEFKFYQNTPAPLPVKSLPTPVSPNIPIQ